MKNDEESPREKYGITYSTETVFHNKKYKYKKLANAVNYAKIVINRNAPNAINQSENDDKKIS